MSGNFIDLPQNKVLRKLREGKIVLGTCAYSFSPDIVQMAGYCGLDFCRIDNEHAWRQDSALENMIRASLASGITALCRVDRDNPFLIRKALELGSQAIVVPQIETRKEAQAVINAAKFPPLGTRGFGNLNQSGRYGVIDAGEWIQWSNSEIMVGSMIETEKALHELDGILSLDGLDFVLIGPADLSLSLGLDKPSVNDNRVQDAIKTVVSAARKHRKYVMLGVASPWAENAGKYIDMGVNMIEIGHDFSILRTVWTDTLHAIKQRAE